MFEESHSPKRDVSPYGHEENNSPSSSPKKNGSPIGRKTGSPPKTSSKMLKPQNNSKAKKSLNLSTTSATTVSRNTKSGMNTLPGI